MRLLLPLLLACTHPSAPEPDPAAPEVEPACAAPWTGGPRFHPDPTWLSTEDAAGSPGIVVGDFTGDGRPDVFVPRMGAQDRLMVRTDQGWEDAGLLPDEPDSPSLGGATADLDDDGDLDLYVLRMGAPDVVHLWDAGRFRPGPSPGGDPHEARWSASFGDADGDLDLDVFLGSQTLVGGVFGDVPPDRALAAPGDDPSSLPEPDDNHLLLWDDGLWDATPSLPTTARGAWTFVAPWFPIDSDARPDLYVVNDFGPIRRRNAVHLAKTPFGLIDATSRFGLDVRVFGMGAHVSDINRDGRPDVLLSSVEDLVLLQATDGELWVRVDAALGLVVPPAEFAGVGRFLWGNAMVDVDADGDLDVLAGAGRLLDHDGGEPAPQEVDRFLAWEQDDSFTEVAADWGLDRRARWRGLVVTDLDGDGSPDVLRGRWGGAPELLLNTCTDGAWLEVSLEQPPPNRRGVGASVEVRTEIDTWIRWVMAGGTAPASGGPPTAWFGLGASTAGTVTVTWPDGGRTTVGPIDLRQRVVVNR